MNSVHVAAQPSDRTEFLNILELFVTNLEISFITKLPDCFSRKELFSLLEKSSIVICALKFLFKFPTPVFMWYLLYTN